MGVAIHPLFHLTSLTGLGGGEDAGSQIPVVDQEPSPFYNVTLPELVRML